MTPFKFTFEDSGMTPTHPRLCSLRRKPITAAVRGTLITLLAITAGQALMPASSWAAEPGAAVSSERQRYDIAPGPLDETLASFAARAGINITMPPNLVTGKRSNGLKGDYTHAQALNQLLAGTGLDAVGSGKSYVLKQLPQIGGEAGETTLAQVKVTASGLHDGTSEGTGSYRAGYSKTATKLSLSPRETPQTISVVSRQQMDDFAMTSVDDALKTVSGVVVTDRGNNGSAYYSRGFELQSQYDGIPNPAGISEWNDNPPIDNAFLDRVEVLQGASGLLTGAGNPGGTINLVRKRPTESFQGQAEVQLGSWNERRIVGDISGPLLESGRIRGRLIAVAEDSDSFVDYVYKNRRGAYGIVEADLTETTTLSTSVQYQKQTGRNHFGVPFAADGSDAGLGRSSFFGDANNRTTKEYTLYTVELAQKLAANWQFKAAYSHGRTDGDIQNYSYISGDLDATTGDGMTLEREKHFQRKITTHAMDVYVSGPVDFWGRQHELAFGFNGSSKRFSYQGTGNAASTAINVYTFDPAALGELANGDGYSGASKITQTGMYGVGRFSLADALKLIVGARISNYEDKNLMTGVSSQKETSVLTPYAGLIYDLNKQFSAYASYSDIFTPQSSKSADGKALKPVVGSNYEVGIKGELLDKRLNVAAAVFRLEQTNLARLDPSVAYSATNACGGFCYSAADKVLSQGLDLSANGAILPGWNISAGYTYVNSEYASGTNEGQRYMTYLPQHNARLASSYKLPGTAWTVGGNVAVYSKTYLSDVSWVSGNPWTIRQGGFALVGLNAKYQIDPRTELTLAVSNLFDRNYRAHLETRDYATFGEPRKLMANLKYHF